MPPKKKPTKLIIKPKKPKNPVDLMPKAVDAKKKKPRRLIIREKPHMGVGRTAEEEAQHWESMKEIGERLGMAWNPPKQNNEVDSDASIEMDSDGSIDPFEDNDRDGYGFEYSANDVYLDLDRFWNSNTKRFVKSFNFEQIFDDDDIYDQAVEFRGMRAEMTEAFFISIAMDNAEEKYNDGDFLGEGFIDELDSDEAESYSALRDYFSVLQSRTHRDDADWHFEFLNTHNDQEDPEKMERGHTAVVDRLYGAVDKEIHKEWRRFLVYNPYHLFDEAVGDGKRTGRYIKRTKLQEMFMEWYFGDEKNLGAPSRSGSGFTINEMNARSRVGGSGSLLEPNYYRPMT